ncbi:SPOR domain-containing protein [Marinibactrum halimedae]|uniref:SPOR domain-containing protein n=1 Tax=Marinibactrum halimedae TaxID=1444977 RepID=A0AA37T869_9GAMM|nr:SPOR domain-containing protein [Marinibactrum halimedae]MCD9459751.1 SPOR domain-containing protein [Marinibactrum halimedae]GLS24492.1 hypothetical protein GCM10007877_02040 [Marinibactrum halimedae]
MPRDFAKKPRARSGGTRSNSTRKSTRSNSRTNNSRTNNSRNNSRSNANRRSSTHRNSSESHVPGWVWLFTGSLLGAFVMFLIYLQGLTPDLPNQQAPTHTPTPKVVESKPTPKPETPTKATTPKAKQPESKQAAQKDEGVPKPRFDFYTILKESEVAVPTPKHSGSTPKEPAGPELQYLLQAGSFRSANDADRMRAELILMNLEATIETVKVRNSETWHRVVVGPFDNRSKMAKARSILASQSISPLLLRRPKEG